MRTLWVGALLAAVAVLLIVLAIRAVVPHKGRLLLTKDVEIIMNCKDTGVEYVCKAEGWTYRGKYDAWVE